MRRLLFILLLTITVSALFASENGDNSSDEKAFNFGKLRMEVRESFDPLYPLDVKDFYFYQGEQRISKEELIAITGDELLLKNEQKIKDIRRGGLAGAAVIGGIATTFFIPSLAFIIVQSNYMNIPALQIKDSASGERYGSWLEYYEANFHTHFLPGIITTLLTGVAVFAFVVDLTVTFALIYRYKNNHKLYNDAIERYNKRFKSRYSYMPDFGVKGSEADLYLGFKLNL